MRSGQREKVAVGMFCDVTSAVRVAFWCVVAGIALGLVIGFSAASGSASTPPPPHPAVVAPANPADRV
jgi:hypothetical protein